jgi:YgiT-type zinc finger domain-containing protein
MINITSCPSCGSDKIKRVQRNCTREFQGQTYTVPNLEFHECPDCGEKVYDRQAMRKIEAHSPAFAKTRKRKQVRVAANE